MNANYHVYTYIKPPIHLRSFILATFQRINADPIHLEFSPLQRYSANADPQLVRSPAVCMHVASLIFFLPVEICPGFTSAVALHGDYSGTRWKMIDECKMRFYICGSIK